MTAPVAPVPPGSGPVVLVGMMGSGKSNVGKRLAKKLGWAFVDSDAEIVARAGKSIPEIFATDGEAAFRDLEAAVVTELLEGDPHRIIATGGGAVLRDATRQALIDHATVVWLRATAGPLAHRIKDDGSRPLLGDDPAAALTRLVAEREPLYRSVADEVIEVDNLPRKVVTKLVLAALRLAPGSDASPVRVVP